MSLSIGELVGFIDLDTSAAEGAVSKFDGLLGDATSGWGQMLGGAGAAGAVLFGAGLAGAMNAEPARDKLAAALGGTSEDSERFGKIAGQVYSNGFGMGVEDVNLAMEAVVTSIRGMRKASDADLQAMTEAAMTYADVMGVDVSRAAQVAGTMIQSGLAENGTEAFDLLMAASQKVPAALREDVLDATEEYGQFFTQLGMDGPEAMAMLAEGAKKGMYGIDKAGDAVKEFTIRATDMSTASKDAYKMIGLDAGDMANAILAGGDKARGATDKIIDGLLSIKDPAKRANASIALFGTPLEDLSTKDVPKFLRSLQSGGKGLGKFKGAVDRAGETAYDNATTNLAMFGRKLKTEFVETIGGSVLPKVTELTGSLNDKLAPAVGVVGDALSAGKAFLEDHKEAASLLAGVILSLLIPNLILLGIHAMVSAYKQVAAWVLTQAAAIRTVAVFVATRTVIVAGWALMGAKAMLGAAKMAAAWLIALGPVGLVIAAVVGVAVLVIKNWDKITKFTRKAWDAITKAVSKAWNKIKDWVSTGVAAVTGLVKAGGAKAKALMTAAWDAVKSVVDKAWQKIKDLVATGVTKAVSALGKLSSIVGKVRGYFKDAKDAAVAKMGELVTWLKGLPGKVTGAVGDLGGVLTGAGNAIMDGLLGGIEAGWEKVKSKLSSITNMIPDWKGPMEVDAKLLTPNGAAIMDSLVAGLQQRLPALEGMLSGVTAGMPAMVAAGAPASTRTVERHTVDRRGPLIGTVVQQSGESADTLAERLWFKTRTRG